MCSALPQFVAARPILLCRRLGRAGHRAGHHGEDQDGGNGGRQSGIFEIHSGDCCSKKAFELFRLLIKYISLVSEL